MSGPSIDLDQLADEIELGGHSVFSPSSSARWLECSGSLIPNLFAPNESSEYAAYGTVAHDLTEKWLRTGEPQYDKIGTNVFIESGEWGHLIDIDEEMLEFVRQAVEYCEILPGKHLVEQRVYYSQLTPIRNQGGTADHIAMSPGLMIITDHKFGRNIMVDAKNNTQGLLYALGAFYAWDSVYEFERIVIRISQPTMDNFDQWEVSRGYLLDFAQYVKERAAAAWDLEAPRKPSAAACQWCRVSASCAANAAMQHAIVAEAWADIPFDGVSPDQAEQFRQDVSDPLGSYSVVPKSVYELSTEEMATLMLYRGHAEKWWQALAEELESRVMGGLHVPGFKVVEGRSHRVFSNKGKAVKHLIDLGLKRSELFKEALVSPSQAEALLKKKGRKTSEMADLIGHLVIQPKGKPTLVPESDRRRSIADLTADVFSDI